MNTYIIAEIGTCHCGSLGKALYLIDAAVRAGCTAVKFQKRNPDVCVPDSQKHILKDTPWGKISYINYKHNLEFGKKEFDIINDYCEKRDIHWGVSVWDLDSLKFISEYNTRWIKLASACITNLELVKKIVHHCVKSEQELIISTGMSTQQDINNLFECLISITDRYWVLKNVITMHCNSSYPTPLEEINLRRISKLQKICGSDNHLGRVGYSGHEEGYDIAAASVLMGVSHIEKHICYKKTDWVGDAKCSLTYKELCNFVEQVRRYEIALGTDKIEVTPSEEEPRRRLQCGG